MFGDGEPGALYSPDDFSALFPELLAGTTPVTALGQPVGLPLDKSKGLALGPELCTDPGLNNPAAWSFGGATPGWSVFSGKAEITQTAASNRWLVNGDPLTVGKVYEVRADVIVTSGACSP